MNRHEVIAMVLAGGAGRRLHPLTAKRCKPAVPFGGVFRAIDFTLLNCLSAGLDEVFVLAQYRADSLREHIAEEWGHAPLSLSLELLTPRADGSGSGSSPFMTSPRRRSAKGTS